MKYTVTKEQNARWVFFLDEHDRWHWQARDEMDILLVGSTHVGYKSKQMAVLDAIGHGYDPDANSLPAVTWVFYKDSAGEWRWRVKATNGQIIGASSEGYSRHSDAVTNAKVFGFRGYLVQSDEIETTSEGD